ncbi:hypothetical protein HYALB_00002057 [Hymenoscyphus albidus]|uniref:Uncharacterized protein n=1 Tax=Hymenoscyphus albidus TaxID=595503 RepID=A0A9N9PQM0_9HELO|nr:hypothetical protein HYALB_00002057 [Hymenoscyphus albidus]
MSTPAPAPSREERDTIATISPNEATEPFPSLDDSPSPSPKSYNINPEPVSNENRTRRESTTSTITERLRSASKSFQESNPPTGMWLATGNIASSVPSLSDIRRGSYGSEGWSGEGQVREKERRESLTRRGSSQSDLQQKRRTNSGFSNTPRSPGGLIAESLPEVTETEQHNLHVVPSGVPVDSMATVTLKPVGSEVASSNEKRVEERHSSDTNLTPNTTSFGKTDPAYRTEPFDNGYQFPPKHDWKEASVIGLKAAWKFTITPVGFLIVVYGLNVVAWGGMLFLLLCNASPAMCKPTCNDINSPRRIWIEIDSQILNALFCVTGFGTIPWRFRDLYYLMQYRIQKKEIGLRRLAGINRGWLRLPGSEALPAEFGPEEAESGAYNVPESALAFPSKKQSNAPLTGIRAPPTKMWKLDFVVWSMVWNTFLQAVLSGFMWGLNRYDRPSWSTGLFVALACMVAAAGGIMSFIEGKHVNAIEGVPISDADRERLARDREAGITHYNNIKDAKPKEKKADEEKGLFKRKAKAAESVQIEESAIREGTTRILK